MMLRGSAMSARQSALSVNDHTSNLRNPQDRIPTSGSEGQKATLMRRMKDCSLRLIFDCRFSIVDLRSASYGGGSPIPCPRSGHLDPQSQIDNRQLSSADPKRC